MFSYQADVANGLLMVLLGYFIRLWIVQLTNRLNETEHRLERLKEDVSRLEMIYREKHAELVTIVLAMKEQFIRQEK